MPNESSIARLGKTPRLLISLLTGVVLLIHGYHPYAEDGGLYVAGVKRVLDPTLYGANPAFVTAHLRYSVFAPMVAALVRATFLPLPWVLLALYLASAWMTLWVAWLLAARATESRSGRLGAVALLACWFALPVAGTSLMLMDPYLTARSFSTPLTLYALAAALDAVAAAAARQARAAWLAAGIALLCAALLHPLMAGYGCFAVLLLAALGARQPPIRRYGPLVLGLLALAVASWIQVHTPPESPAYVRIALTRYYWFPRQWTWYEQLGIPAPLAVIALLGWRKPANQKKILAQTALTLTAIAAAIALLFSRAGLPVHAAARMQPLRCLQMVYFILIVLLGAWLGERWLRDRPWRWAAMLAVAGGALLLSERNTFPASAHLELPWLAPVNPWEQGFLWARNHTPKNALFALSARYITRGPKEDAQGFRAIAERDALPDYSKDGGEAAITPRLTEAWVRGQTAQNGLEHESDQARETALQPLGVSWAILEAGSPTAWHCPYANATIKVCKLP